MLLWSLMACPVAQFPDVSDRGNTDVSTDSPRETGGGTGDTAPPDPLTDADGDGVPAGDDCDDNDPLVFPGQLESCGDGVDRDCDGESPDCILAGNLELNAASDVRLWAVEDTEGAMLSSAGTAWPKSDGVAIGLGGYTRRFLHFPESGKYAYLFAYVNGVPAVTRFDFGPLAGRLSRVASVGDLDQDGLDELMVVSFCEWWGDDGRCEEGKGSLLLDEPDRAHTFLLTSAMADRYTAGAIIDMTKLDAKAHVELQGPTDSCPGRDAVDLGAGRWALGGPCHADEAGIVWVLDGMPKDPDLSKAATATIVGQGGQYHAMGWTLAAGDVVDDDGRNDLLIGNFGDERAESVGQAAFVVDADSVGVGGTINTAAKRVWTTPRWPYSTNTGSQVEAIGDLDGDGSDDVVVAVGGDHHRSLGGAVFVLTDTSAGNADLDADAYAELHLDDDSRWGTALAVMDVDRDGVNDIVSTAMDYGVEQNGVVHIVSGNDLSTGGNVNAAEVSFARINRAGSDFERVGMSVEAGDVNGDGWDDVVVGIETAYTMAGVLLGGPQP